MGNSLITAFTSPWGGKLFANCWAFCCCPLICSAKKCCLCLSSESNNPVGSLTKVSTSAGLPSLPARPISWTYSDNKCGA